MNRGSDRRSALATVTQVLIVTILAVAVIAQVSRLAADDASPDSMPDVPGAVIEEEPDGAAPYVTTDDVNLRSGPGTSHAVVQVLPVQTDLVVTGQAAHGYSPVRVDNTSAWVSTTYIAPAGNVLVSTMSIDAEPPVVAEPTAVPTAVPAVAPTQPLPAPTVAPIRPPVETVEEPAVMTVSETLVAEEHAAGARTGG